MEIEIVLPVILLLLLIAYFRTSTEETQNESQSHDSLPINPKRSHRKARYWYEDSETHFEDEPGHLAFLVSLDENGGKLKKLCKEGGKDIEEVLVYIRSDDHLLHSVKTIVRNYSEKRYEKYFGELSQQNGISQQASNVHGNESQLDCIKRYLKEDDPHSITVALDEANSIANKSVRDEAYLLINEVEEIRKKNRRRPNEDYSQEKLSELKWPAGLTYEEKLAHIQHRKSGRDFMLALKFARKLELEYPQRVKGSELDTDSIVQELKRDTRYSKYQAEVYKRREMNIDKGGLDIPDKRIEGILEQALKNALSEPIQRTRAELLQICPRQNIDEAFLHISAMFLSICEIFIKSACSTPELKNIYSSSVNNQFSKPDLMRIKAIINQNSTVKDDPSSFNKDEYFKHVKVYSSNTYDALGENFGLTREATEMWAINNLNETLQIGTQTNIALELNRMKLV